MMHRSQMVGHTEYDYDKSRLPFVTCMPNFHQAYDCESWTICKKHIPLTNKKMHTKNRIMTLGTKVPVLLLVSSNKIHSAIGFDYNLLVFIIRLLEICKGYRPFHFLASII